MRLKDKVAIITGGSRGIGFATADAFLREGAKVAVAASSEKNAEAAVEKLKAIHPDAEVVGISPNLGSFESVKEEFDKVEKQFGRIDILVNNAGVSESTPFTSYTEADFDRVIDLNVKGVFNATRAVVDGMIKNHSSQPRRIWTISTINIIRLMNQKKLNFQLCMKVERLGPIQLRSS